MAKRTKRRSSVNVFGRKVPIKYIDLTSEGAVGLYSTEKKVIVIQPNIIGEELTQTLLHECIHAVFDRTGITQSVSTEVEEIIAENIASFVVENFYLRDK